MLGGFLEGILWKYQRSSSGKLRNVNTSSDALRLGIVAMKINVRSNLYSAPMRLGLDSESGFHARIASRSEICRSAPARFAIISIHRIPPTPASNASDEPFSIRSAEVVRLPCFRKKPCRSR